MIIIVYKFSRFIGYNRLIIKYSLTQACTLIYVLVRIVQQYDDGQFRRQTSDLERAIGRTKQCLTGLSQRPDDTLQPRNVMVNPRVDTRDRATAESSKTRDPNDGVHAVLILVEDGQRSTAVTLTGVFAQFPGTNLPVLHYSVSQLTIYGTKAEGRVAGWLWYQRKGDLE